MIAEAVRGRHRDAQVLGIRRLMDERRDVISLGRLLRDIKKNAVLFTRENYVSGTGLPYNLPSIDPSMAIPSGGVPGTAFVSWDSPLGGSHLTEAAHTRFAIAPPSWTP